MTQYLDSFVYTSAKRRRRRFPHRSDCSSPSKYTRSPSARNNSSSFAAYRRSSPANDKATSNGRGRRASNMSGAPFPFSRNCSTRSRASVVKEVRTDRISKDRQHTQPGMVLESCREQGAAEAPLVSNLNSETTIQVPLRDRDQDSPAVYTPNLGLPSHPKEHNVPRSQWFVGILRLAKHR